MADFTIGRPELDALAETVRDIPPQWLSRDQRAQLEGVVTVARSLVDLADTSSETYALETDDSGATTLRVNAQSPAGRPGPTIQSVPMAAESAGIRVAWSKEGVKIGKEWKIGNVHKIGGEPIYPEPTTSAAEEPPAHRKIGTGERAWDPPPTQDEPLESDPPIEGDPQPQPTPPRTPTIGPPDLPIPDAQPEEPIVVDPTPQDERSLGGPSGLEDPKPDGGR